MRSGIIGIVLLVLIAAALPQNVYIGSLGGLIMVVLAVLLLTGKLYSVARSHSFQQGLCGTNS